MSTRFSPSRRAFLGGAIAATLALVSRSPAAQFLPNSLPCLRQKLDELKLKGGGTIDLPAGDVFIQPYPGEGAALVLPHGTELRGAGKYKTRLLMAPGATGHVVSSYEGGATVRDLTIDGQAPLRPADRGHNLRLEGDGNLVERVVSINSCGYGVALGQRRYIRNSVLRDVDIIDSSGDGVDLKNRLGKTEITIENVRVERFGLSVDAKSSAGIDLRGKCTLRNAKIVISRQLYGLRFRPGDPGSSNGPGAHGSSASEVEISGAESGTGIAVLARNVSLTDFKASGVEFGLQVGGADGFRASNGTLSGRTAALDQFHDYGPMTGVFEHVEFAGALFARVKPKGDLSFRACAFRDCLHDLKSMRGLTFVASSFGKTCE